MKTILTLYIWLILCVGLFVGSFITFTVNRHEQVECQQWTIQAEQYESFFLTKWQDEQCRAHNIIINAPIK